MLIGVAFGWCQGSEFSGVLGLDTKVKISAFYLVTEQEGMC